MKNERFDRNIRFFGIKGQERIASTKVTAVGGGGLGCHLVQQLALLGTRDLTVIDSEDLAETDRNRNVCARASDPVPGSWKTDLCERLILAIDPDIRVTKIPETLVSEAAFRAIIEADYVFGCLDSEGARLVLTELSSAYARPYFDLATDITEGERLRYGGRVCFAPGVGIGCLVCRDELDLDEARAELGGPEFRQMTKQIYGMDRELIGEKGPSVVSINGVVASLAVTEFAVLVSGIRAPNVLLKYYGHRGTVVVNNDPPRPDCYYCCEVRGQREKADVERYIREGVGAYLK
jgi:molybdopterin/thiamine biosynthesis adenylyltransferase